MNGAGAAGPEAVASPSRLLLFAAGVLLVLAWGLGALGLLVPVRPYAWAEEPGLRAQVDPDAVLAVTVLSVLGLGAAIGSLVIARRLERRRLLWAAALALAVCVYRLAVVLPAYSG